MSHRQARSRPRRGRGPGRRNALHSALLIGGMTLLLGACGWIVAGLQGLVVAGLLGALGLAATPRIAPRMLLGMLDARPLPVEAQREVHVLCRDLAGRAGLRHTPRLYYLPSPALNAFSVGQPDDAAIAMTSGLLQRLSLREIAGILAHEIGHISRNDMRVMALADVIARLTRSMSLFGILLLAVNVPLFVARGGDVPWLLVALLIAAPTVGGLLQLALSRTRELDADLSATALTGDPAGLASALVKVERQERSGWRRVLASPGGEPAILRTHPNTRERIERLLALERAEPVLPADPAADEPIGHSALPTVLRRRRSAWWPRI